MNTKTETKVKDIAITLCKELSTKQSDINFIQNNLTGLFNTYSLLKEEMRAKMGKQTELDRHKIAALFSFAIVAHKPLETKGKNSSYLARNANYFVALKVATAILASFKDKTDFTIDNRYTQEFFKLLKLNEMTIDNICKNEGKIQISILFFMSHLFYFIDECDTRTH